jgi:uncharacterized protein (TIGR00296 family)
MELEKGAFLVRTARKVIEEYVKSGNKYEPGDYPKEFDGKGGVFTTIHMHHGHELRGCIGYPEPVMPLIEALAESAVSVTRDPRFPPLSAHELDKIVVEVSVLTEPKLIEVKDPREYPKKIRIGKDGLIIERGLSRGLLLPQVPVEWKWDAREFLENLCMKAGLPPDAWLELGVKIYSFGSEIFSEKSPRGGVVREGPK